MTKYVIFRSCFNTLLVDQNQLVLRKEDLDLAEKDPKFVPLLLLLLLLLFKLLLSLNYHYL